MGDFVGMKHLTDKLSLSRACSMNLGDDIWFASENQASRTSNQLLMPVLAALDSFDPRDLNSSLDLSDFSEEKLAKEDSLSSISFVGTKSQELFPDEEELEDVPSCHGLLDQEGDEDKMTKQPTLNERAGCSPASVFINTDTALHRACQVFPRRVQMVEAALKLDPSAIQRKAFIQNIPSQTRKLQDALYKSLPEGHRRPKPPSSTPEPFQLPINIALHHNASLQVLDLLVKADPSQLSKPDGIHGINSLCLALDRWPNDVARLGLLLVSNPDCIKTVCGFHELTPLHIACRNGASLKVIRQLVRMYPAALLKKSAEGLLPRDMVQQRMDLQPAATKKGRDCVFILDFLTTETNKLQV